MKNSRKRFYGEGLPGVSASDLKGKLIVVEGPDGSGRSTQIAHLTNWLEERGHAVVTTGLKRSELVAPELALAKRGNVLSPRTLSLFYATDFADQLENSIVPALRAGFIVLADRYIYTLMARDLVRGADLAWLQSIYGIAIVPDLVVHLRVSPPKLLERYILGHRELDYWESGMDIGYSRSWYDSFLRYQGEVQKTFMKLRETYGFDVIDAMRPRPTVTRDLQVRIEGLLK